MKHLLYIIFSLILLVSCSMDETKEVVPDKEIEFVVSTTKATEININNFESFQVKAVYKDYEQISEEFSDIYSRNDEDLYYTSENKHVWPETGMLKFYAYYPYDESLLGPRYDGDEELYEEAELEVTENGDLLLKGFSVPIYFSEHADFISAVAEGSRYDENAVSLNFKHNLAQIEIRGKNTNEGYKCFVHAALIVGMGCVGDFNFSSEKWTVDEDSKSVCGTIYENPIELTADPVSLMGTIDNELSDNAMLIPQSLTPWDVSDMNNEQDGAFIALLVKITTATDAKIYPVLPNRDLFEEGSEYEEYDLVAIPIADKWEAGNKYIYTWDIPTVGGYVYPGKPYPSQGLHDPFCSGDPIMGNRIKTLTPTIMDWETPAQGE